MLTYENIYSHKTVIDCLKRPVNHFVYNYAAKIHRADPVRARLNSLEGNQNLANMAPMAVRDARTAVVNAEQPSKDPELADHLVFIAERKVDIAQAESQRRYLEQQRSEFIAERDNMQLEARIKESELAKLSATQAKDEAAQAQQNLYYAKQETAGAKQKVKDIQHQLDQLDARNSARGSVITLGDVLFDFNKSDIKPAAISHLAKLATFLNTNIDRNITIEGHTDNIGSKKFNLLLSQRRADSIKDYLIGQGVARGRIQTSGKGISLPVIDNTTADHREQNRRVEVIISEPVT
jgi:outer membrane protein OmpA-like peptidoglycan-associated protein